MLAARTAAQEVACASCLVPSKRSECFETFLTKETSWSSHTRTTSLSTHCEQAQNSYNLVLSHQLGKSPIGAAATAYGLFTSSGYLGTLSKHLSSRTRSACGFGHQPSSIRAHQKTARGLAVSVQSSAAGSIPLAWEHPMSLPQSMIQDFPVDCAYRTPMTSNIKDVLLLYVKEFMRKLYHHWESICCFLPLYHVNWFWRIWNCLPFAAEEGPVCVVTGSSRGIGRAIALCLGKQGARVRSCVKGNFQIVLYLLLEAEN